MKPDRDMDKLVPEFRTRVELLLTKMQNWGFDPMVWEAWRSFERARLLQARGVGVAKSVHCYGLAVDLVSESRKWSPRPTFWMSLEKACAELNLCWGGHFRRVDRPHVQALPAAMDNWVRKATPRQIRKACQVRW